MPAVTARKAEGMFHTTEEVKERATEIYSNWGLTLSDAINVFLVKSIEVGGLPFDMRLTKMPSHDELMARAYKALLDADGVPVLPADWDDYDE